MRLLITGISGYVARVALPFLLADDAVDSITGLDVKPLETSHPKLKFITGDIRSFPLRELLRDIDVVLHLAFIVTEIKDKKTIHDINVNGTARLLEAMKGTGVKKLVAASSITAYGSHPDHPGLITEDTPLRGNKESYYSASKLEMERLLDILEKENPEMIVTRLRPSILCGAGTDNFFLWILQQKLVLFPMENPDGLPVVYDRDVGRAFHLAVKIDAPGAFNITGGNLTVTAMCGILRKPSIALPWRILKPISDFGYLLGLSPMSSHWALLGRHPFNASNEKAKRVLGWTPEKSPEESFIEMVETWKAK